MKKNLLVIRMFTLMLGILFSVMTANSAVRTWDGPNTGGSWTLATNWSANTVPVANDDVIIPASVTGAITGVPTISLVNLTINGSCSWESNQTNPNSSTITVTGSFTIPTGVTFTLGASNARFNFTLAGGATGLIAGTGNFVFNAASGTTTSTLTISGNLTIEPSALITGAGTFGPFVLSNGATLQIGNTLGITTTGATGAIRTAGTRTYSTGASYIYNGTAAQVTGNGLNQNSPDDLTINNTAGVSLSAATTMTGTLTVNAGSAFSLSTFALGSPTSVVLETGTVAGSSITGTGALTLGGVAGNGITVNTTGTGAVGASISTPVALGTANRTLTVADGIVDNDLTVNGIISGARILTKAGAGRLVLTNVNTYTLGTIINAGTVSIDETANLGAATSALTIANGATLRTTTSINVILNRPITLGTGGANFDLTVPLYFQGASSTVTGTSFITNGNDLIINRTAVGTNAIGAITVNTGRLHVFTAASITGSTIGVNGGATLDFSITGGFTIPNTNPVTFANGAILSNRIGTLTIDPATTTFPTQGTMIFNSDDQNTTDIVISGNYPALTGDLTLQVGPTGMITVGPVSLTGTLNGGSSFDLTKSSTGVLNLGTVGSAATTLQDLTISGGTLVATAGTTTLSGNFTNNGIFTHSSGLVSFTGAAAKVLSGTSTTAFNNLTFNTAGGATISRDITVAAAFTLTNGIINTAVSPNGLLTINAGGTAPAAGSATAHVVGPMTKIGNTAFSFPLGNGTIYRQLDISVLSGTLTFTGRYFQANPQTAYNNVMGPGVNHIGVCEYWTLDRAEGAGTATVQLNFGGSCNGNPYVNDPASLLVARFTGTGSLPNNTWVNAGSVTPTSISVKSAPVSNFSPFTIGSSSIFNPLPVKFGGIKAYTRNNGIQVDWTALTELNVNRYEVERSADGIHFTTIGQTTALNNGNRADYGWFDAAPLTGTNFYRIRSVDQDAKTSFSIIVRVDQGKITKISVYPNPVQNGTVSFQSPAFAKGTYTVDIFNTNGQRIVHEQFTHAGGSVSQSIQLPAGIKAGMYHLQVQTEIQNFNQSFLVQ